MKRKTEEEKGYRPTEAINFLSFLRALGRPSDMHDGRPMDFSWLLWGRYLDKVYGVHRMSDTRFGHPTDVRNTFENPISDILWAYVGPRCAMWVTIYNSTEEEEEDRPKTPSFFSDFSLRHFPFTFSRSFTFINLPLIKKEKKKKEEPGRRDQLNRRNQNINAHFAVGEKNNNNNIKCFHSLFEFPFKFCDMLQKKVVGSWLAYF